MKFIYVLEDEERLQKDLFETIKNIDPKLNIRFFSSLEQFHEWLKIAMQDGPLSLANGGVPFKEDLSTPVTPASTHELTLVIAKNEFLGIQNMGLIKRAREFFLRKKVCSEQEPTALIITAFDSPTFDIKLAEERIINNVIFKPFDKLILKQHLEYALTGHHPVNSNTIAAIKIQSTIEMLKDVSLRSISEIGFSTINNHEIRIGAHRKYYSELFRTDEKKSVMAVCKSCKEISPSEFHCEFIFFGIDNKQIANIRRGILTTKNHQTKELKNTHGNRVNVLILDIDENIPNDLKAFLTDKYKNVDIFTYFSNGQLLADLSDKESEHRTILPPQFEICIANYDFLDPDKQKHWEDLNKAFIDRGLKYGISNPSAPNLYIISRTKLSIDITKDMAEWCKDVFFTILDKPYINKKLITNHSTLLNKEPTNLGNKEDSSILKVANPVEITEISEAGLVLKYYRAISIGSFREFILWRPKELDNPEIVGTVNFTEKNQGGGDVFYNHFVFFGMKDHFLKHIRLWLRSVHIQTKEKGS